MTTFREFSREKCRIQKGFEVTASFLSSESEDEELTESFKLPNKSFKSTSPVENQCGSDDEGEEEFDYEKENKNVNCSPSSLYRQGKSSSPKIIEENESEGCLYKVLFPFSNIRQNQLLLFSFCFSFPFQIIGSI